MHTKNYLLSFLFVACFLLFWVLTTTPEWLYHPHWVHTLKGIGSFFGVAGYTFISFAFLLSSRWKKLEDWLGGLDQIYQQHHRIALWGSIFLLFHPLILALRWIPHHWDRFFLFIFPIHHRLSVNLGSFSFFLLVLLIGITILKILPYDKWKMTHQFMSLFFILATLHILTSEKRFSSSFLSYILLYIPIGIGFFGILYKQLITPFFIKQPLFQIVSKRFLSDNVVEIFLEPQQGKLLFIPGQYAFFKFKGDQISNESHPFTLCRSPQESRISILVKTRGDFTRSLYQYLKPSDLAWLEGPFGRFDYTKEGSLQIWIAGGIGIVPFLVWSRILYQTNDRERKVDLFYCVHRRVDAIFVDELYSIAHELSHFRLFLFCSEENHHLSVDSIQNLSAPLQEKKILMCGPQRLTKDFTKKLQMYGVKRKNILFEDFEFF